MVSNHNTNLIVFKYRYGCRTILDDDCIMCINVPNFVTASIMVEANVRIEAGLTEPTC
jgi:hypothetical protein